MKKIMEKRVLFKMVKEFIFKVHSGNLSIDGNFIPKEELVKIYKDFIGKPVTLSINGERIGKIVDVKIEDENAQCICIINKDYEDNIFRQS